jgi:hypothetical protein
MTKMDAVKSYLKQVELYNIKIDSKIEELDRLEELLLKITSTLKPDVVSSSGSQDKMGDAIAKVVDLKEEINQTIDEYVDKKREIESVIDKVEDADQLKVLKKRYILFEPWEQIAYEIGCTHRHATRIHGQALLSVSKIVKNLKMS